MTGKRRSFVLLKLTPEHRPREMWKVVKAIQGLGKRASLASITSKLITTLAPSLDGTNPDELDIEYSSDTVWLRGHEVSSSYSTPPSGSPTVASGWVDTILIAKLLRLDLAAVKGQLDSHLHSRQVDWATWIVAGKDIDSIQDLDTELDIILLQKVGAQPEGVAVISLEDFWAALGKPFCFAKLCFPRSFNLISGGRPFGAPWARVTLAGSSLLPFICRIWGTVPSPTVNSCMNYTGHWVSPAA